MKQHPFRESLRAIPDGCNVITICNFDYCSLPVHPYLDFKQRLPDGWRPEIRR